MDIKSAIGGAIASAAISVGVVAGVGTDTNKTVTYIPEITAPSAPALESGAAVAYFCKPDIRESIDNSPPGVIPSAADPGRAPVIHICHAPDGTVIRLTGSGKFIEAKDSKGLPKTEAQIQEYLR